MQEQDIQETKSKALVLRILSGPHSGAEINLQEKPLTIGKGDQCDIVLMDEALAEQHAKIFIKDGNVFCSSQDGDVFVDGVAIEGERKLVDFQPVVCGTTLFAIGPNDVVWPTIEAPQKQIVPGKKDLTEEGSEEKVSLEAKSKGKKFRLRKLVAFSFLIIITLSFGCLYFFRPKTADVLPEVSRTFPIVALKKSIEDVLEKNSVNMKHVKISLSGQKFILQCYVNSSALKSVLEKELKALPKVMFQSMHIYVQSVIVEQAQALLNSLQTLTVAPGAELDGVILKGYLYSIDVLPTIKNRLLSEINGLNGIATNLLSPDEIYDLASNLLSQYNLMGLLKIQPMRTGLMVMGNIQASDEPRWKEAQKALKKNFNGICKVLSYVAVVAPQAVKKLFFPSPITTVSIPDNEKPWIDLKNGDRYFEGTMLPSAYRIESITTEGIRIQKNDDVVFFTLAEL